MQKQQREDTDEAIGRRLSGSSVSRREFLRIAGVAGATVGVGGGMASLISACGGATTTTAGVNTTAAPATTATTAGSTTTASAATTTSSPASSTTASSAAETGREVKIGVVIPVTGYLALFGESDKWSLGLINKHIGDSFVLGDGKSHKVTWILTDTQSDSNRASQVTSDLIMNTKVDMTVVGGAPDTVNAAADQAEALANPQLASNNVWEAFVFGRGAKMDTVFKWNYGVFLGADQIVQSCLQVANKMQTNKVVSLLEANNADGQAFLTKGTGFPDVFTNAGYKVVFPSLFQPGTEDFTSLIGSYKAAGCEIHVGSNAGNDFPNFWKQGLQQGYHPKMAIEVIAISTYNQMKALGDAILGLIIGFTWHRDWPFKDEHITGMTNAQLADDYEQTQGTMWSTMLTPYLRFQWAVDVLRRTKNIDDKNSIVDAIKSTKTTLSTGPVDFTAPVDPTKQHVVPNVCKSAMCLAQVVKGTGKWLYDVPQVAVIDAPDTVKTIDPVAIKYS
jgi:branched-chain amino acid transport system substrate-binding protein